MYLSKYIERYNLFLARFLTWVNLTTRRTCLYEFPSGWTLVRILKSLVRRYFYFFDQVAFLAQLDYCP